MRDSFSILLGCMATLSIFWLVYTFGGYVVLRNIGNPPKSEEYQGIYMDGWNKGAGRCDSIWHFRQAELRQEWEYGYSSGALDAFSEMLSSDSTTIIYNQFIKKHDSNMVEFRILLDSLLGEI